jgi:hypothetical protein
VIGHGQVGFTVSIEVRHGERYWPATHSVVGGRLENTAARAQKYAHGIAQIIRYGKIRLTVSVEVSYPESIGT